MAISDLLKALDVPAGDAPAVRAVLEKERLTRPGKQRIAAAKLPAVVAVVERSFTMLCDRCRAQEGVGPDDAAVLTVAVADCRGCQGSDDLRALRAMGDACVRVGLRRIVVLGGSPTVRQRLLDLDFTGVELRLVDGDASKASRRADANAAWADVIIVIASSQLPHSVSIPYTQGAAAQGKVITVARRGLAALAEEIERFARGGPRRTG